MSVVANTCTAKADGGGCVTYGWRSPTAPLELTVCVVVLLLVVAYWAAAQIHIRRLESQLARFENRED